MKLLILSNLYPPHYVGGYELHCQTMVEALRNRGHTAHVLTSNHGLEQEDTCDNGSGIERSLRIHGMFGHPWLNIFRLRVQEQHNNQKLREAIIRLKPDLVYVWNMSGFSKSMVFTLQELQIPTVFVVCDHWIARSAESDVWLNWWNAKNISPKHKILRAALTVFGLRRRWHKTAPTFSAKDFVFPRIYFCSRALCEFTAAAGFKVEHGGVIYCPINIQRFTGMPRTADQPLQRLLYVGRLTEDKGVMTALRAMALLKDQFSGHLSIYGHGEKDYENQLKAFVTENNLPVTFEKSFRPEQMPSVYQEHDALLFTSEWAEPFALTPLEAMASGLPVIGTTTGGSGELLRNRENSLTYAAGNAQELACRIIELNDDAAMRARIAIAGYCEVRSRFEESKIVTEVENFLVETQKTWKPIPLPKFA